MSFICGFRGMMKGFVVKLKNVKKILYRIWLYMGKWKFLFVVVIILVIVIFLFNLLGFYLIGVIIDEYIIFKDISGMIWMFFIFVGIYIMIFLLIWL